MWIEQHLPEARRGKRRGDLRVDPDVAVRVRPFMIPLGASYSPSTATNHHTIDDGVIHEVGGGESGERRAAQNADGTRRLAQPA